MGGSGPSDGWAEGVADALATQVVPEASAVVALVGNQVPGPSADLPGWGARFHGLQRGLGQVHVGLLGTVQMRAHAQSSAPCDQHELGALTPAGRSHASARFLADMKAPSRKACAQSSFCSVSRTEMIARHRVSQAPDSSNSFGRLQQGVGEPYPPREILPARSSAQNRQCSLQDLAVVCPRSGCALREGSCATMNCYCASLSSWRMRERSLNAQETPPWVSKLLPATSTRRMQARDPAP